MNELKKFLTENGTDYDMGIINYGRYHKLPKTFENEQVIRFMWKKDSIDKLIKNLKNRGINLTLNFTKKEYCLYNIDGTEHKAYIIYGVDSHVQLPKCLLKNFRTGESLYYIDVLKKKVRKDSARNYNTRFGFYSLSFEEYLSKNYESIISDIINKITPFIEQKVKEITFNNLDKKINKLFIMALFRNPKYVKQINEENAFAQLFDGGYNTEYLLMTEEKINRNYIKDYVPVLLINKTQKSIFLTKALFSGIQIKNNKLFMIMPLHPKFAIVLVSNKYYEDMIKENGENSYILIEEESSLTKLNFQIYANAKANNDDIIGLKEDLEDFLATLNIND